ncbi:MAG: HAMP domain-containing histidine kinase [Polyangiaceae bacterium]|nr:HAMP domain-containing histidine kinase [Polyangiaceae bacterium]
MPDAPLPNAEPGAGPELRVFGYADRAMALAPQGNRLESPDHAVEGLDFELRRQIYRLFLQVRFAIAPIPLLLGSVVVALDPTLWRRIVIVGAIGSVVALSALEDRAVKRGREFRLSTRLAVIALIQGAVVLATGGVMSPVVMAMLMIGFVASTMPGRHAARTLIGCEIAWLWVVAAIEVAGVLGSLLPFPFRSGVGATPPPLFIAALLLVETTIFLVSLAVGARIRAALSELLVRVVAARDDTLRTHVERLDEITRLSGEIAHELKNPLASIKGLAALLARSCAPEQREHLTVLRSEADRMQGKLDEFLNLSRPLVPLTTLELDLSALVSEVCTLHEGQLALQKVRVELLAPTDAARSVRADPRKVRQILVNLLQNAIEASPPGTTIRVDLLAYAEGVRVRITDQGPGLAPGLAERLFEPGVTTKPRGSGFGLTVARGLAEQHGGAVTLESTEGQGCVATLRLPLVPPVTTSSSDVATAPDGVGAGPSPSGDAVLEEATR